MGEAASRVEPVCRLPGKLFAQLLCLCLCCSNIFAQGANLILSTNLNVQPALLLDGTPAGKTIFFASTSTLLPWSKFPQGVATIASEALLSVTRAIWRPSMAPHGERTGIIGHPSHMTTGPAATMVVPSGTSSIIWKHSGDKKTGRPLCEGGTRAQTTSVPS